MNYYAVTVKFKKEADFIIVDYASYNKELTEKLKEEIIKKAIKDIEFKVVRLTKKSYEINNEI